MDAWHSADGKRSVVCVSGEDFSFDEMLGLPTRYVISPQVWDEIRDSLGTTDERMAKFYIRSYIINLHIQFDYANWGDEI